MRAHYIDDRLGKDENDGLTPASAWCSLARANQAVFKPGERLRLRRGGEWRGSLAPTGSGASDCPCVIEGYGSGPRPKIDARGEEYAAVYLNNSDWWTVRGLDVTNSGNDTDPKRHGILIEAEDYGVSRGFLVEDCLVHEVYSAAPLDGRRTGCGIGFLSTGSKNPTRFDGITIRNNHLVTVDSVGILIMGQGRRDTWFPSTNVVIEWNLLEDMGGDAILNIGTDGCIVRRNRVVGGCTRAVDSYAGIWPQQSDNTLICYNEVSGYVGTLDGQGYDCDFNCIGTTHMYNYSHGNDGGFMLICTWAQKNKIPEDIGTLNSTIRRNLSVNDLCRSFHAVGPLVGTRIEENCIYVGEGIDIPVMLVTGLTWPMGGPEDIIVTRNIFAARGTMRYSRSVAQHEETGLFDSEDDDAIPNLRYVGNTYLGNHVAQPHDACSPSHDIPLEQLEELLLDEDGRAKPGFETLDTWLDFMGWPTHVSDACR